MLVLTRKVGEKILIGDGIVVEVVEIVQNSKVRLGITASDNIQVDREEVRRSKDLQKEKKDVPD